MKRIFTTLFFISVCHLFAQTFNGTGGAIPDFPGGTQCFNINVSGLTGNLYSNYGLATVTVNITHPYDGDLEIVLISPNGIQTILSSNNGGAGDNYTNTVFSMSAGTSITAGVAPFTGSFIPEESFYAQNVGQDGNGIWQLCITDEVGGDLGSLVNWSITFAGGAVGSPDPGPNPVATDGCAGAPLICNLNGYTGSTYNTYTWTPATEPSGTSQPTPGPAGTFCGTHINNSSWIRFQASATSVNLTIDVVNCTGFVSGLGEFGIQLGLYNACGAPWTYSPSTLPPNNSAGPAPNDENIPSCYGDGIHGVGNTLSFNNLVIGNIYYIMFDGWAGNQCDYTINVTNGVQVVNITPSSNPICEGDTINLVATSPGTLTTYSWSSVPAGSYPTGSSITVSPTSSTVYTVVASGICGSQSASLPLTVIPSGNPAWTTPSSMCNNVTPLNLNSLITGTTGGSWTGTGVSGSNFNPTGLSAGAYNVTYTTGTAPCQKNEVHPITVLATPSPNITVASPTNICAYQTVLLTVSSPIGGTYTWLPSGSGTSINVTSSGTYSVTVTNVNGCSATDSQLVSITNYPQSNPVIAPSVPVICNGQSVTLSTTVAFVGYTWSTGATTPTTTANTGGSYYVYTQDANGCIDTATTNVITSNITVDITGDLVLCPGEVSTLTGNGGSSYTWSTAATSNTINVNTGGTYFVSSTNSDGCSDADTVTVTTSSASVSISGDNILCPGESTILTASGGTAYSWSTTQTSPSIIVVNPGLFWASTMNADGCTDTAFVNVINSNFNPTLSGDTIVCPGDNTNLVATGGNNYLWNTSATSSTLSVPLNVSTQFYVIITNADGCEDSLTTMVHLYTDFNAAPALAPDADTTNFQTPITIPVTNNDAILAGISIIVPPNHGTASISGNDIIYTPNTGFSGFDTLLYISCDPTCTNLCDTTTVIIKVNSDMLKFPEFISPNGDNSNDYWFLGDLSGYPDNELTILNRWGDALYHAQPYNNEWNGQSNMGIPVMSQGVTDGTYYFVFIPAPGEEPIKGFIEIRK